MFALDIVFVAWLVTACAAFLVPVVFLVGEWTIKPLTDWLAQDEDALPSHARPLSSSRF